MRPGLPDPLLDLLGARWTMGAPVAGCAWFGAGDAVGFGLADGTLAVARAAWEGAARLQPREGGGVELVTATATPPPVMRVGIHAGPCLDVASDRSGGVVSGGLDGRFARVDPDGQVETLASFPGAPIHLVASALTGALACATGQEVHRFEPAPARLELPGSVTALAFNAAGDLAIAHPGGVTLWLAGGGERRMLPSSGTPRSLAWSADGRLLVSGLEEKRARGWRLPEGSDIAMGGDYPAEPLSLAYSVPGSLFATSGGQRVTCWRFDDAGGGAARTECGVGSTVAVTRVACHPARSLIAAGYENGAVLLCPPDGADLVFVRAAGGGVASTLAWSADGDFLALGVAGGEVGVVALPELLFRAAPAAAPAQRNVDP